MTVNEYKNIGESLYSETLENGLRVLFVPKPGYNKSYAFFASDYGGADRRFRLGGKWTDTPGGVAHFLEHKMFDMPDGDNALSKLSSNGASPNAFTSESMTAYYFESTEGFYDNLRILLDFVSLPYFTAESVAKEQGIIGQEIRMVEDSAEHTVYYNLCRCLFEHNPLRDPVIGSIESIAQITEQTLYDCHKVFYNPSNMVLCVTGDLCGEQIVQIARETLTAESGPVPERDYGMEEPEFPANRFINARMEVSAPIFAAGSRLAAAEKGRARLRRQLVGEIALSYLLGRSSPLFTQMYADGVLNDSFGTGIDFAAGSAMVISSGQSPDPQRYFERLLEESGKIASSGLDSRLFSAVKKSAFGKKLRNLSRFDELCRELSEGYFAGFCPLDTFDIIESISDCEAANFIAENFRQDAMVLSVVEPVNAAAR